MSSRARVIAFVAILVVSCAAAGTSVLAGMRGGASGADSSSSARALLADARAAKRPVVLYRSLGGDAGEGKLTVAALGTSPGSPRTAPLACDRVYFEAGRGLCLARGGGFASGYKAMVIDDSLRVRHEVDVAGVPSRARVSPDGRYGSVTLFLSGHSYAAEGAFSTETTLIDLEHGEKIAELEEFTVTRDGRIVTAVDVNFWGVTFADDSDRFYATMATGGKTFLVKGSVKQRRARVVHENVECPSLSPDGTRIAYKRRTGTKSRLWWLTVLDLETMRETPLAETSSVDDQAEWLDDDHVLYGLNGQVSVVRADGTGAPRRFIAQADSPAVVRW
jgi:WD40 repeat protein